MSDISRPPTYSRFTDKRKGTITPPYLDFISRFQKQTELPALVGMLGSIFRRSTPPAPIVVLSAWADRASYLASAYPEGTLLVITDHPLVFADQDAVWTYKSGWFRANQADAPTLGTEDAGVLWDVLDYNHILRWSGTAFDWGPGNPEESREYGFFGVAPTGVGWQLCNGASVAILNADGSLSTETVDNFTTAAYIKGGITAAAIAAASGRTSSDSAGTPTGSVSAPVFTGSSVTTGAPSATTAVDNNADGGSANVGSATHTHSVTAAGTNSAPTFSGNAMAGHDHAPGTQELRRKQMIVCYRR